MAEALRCYLDESGDPNFPIGDGGGSSHYVLGGVALPESRVASIRAEAEAIRKRFFQTGEMKAGAKSLRKNPKRRRELIESISELDAAFVAVAVDKRRIFEDGALAKWKKSFLKYTGGRLWSRVLQVHDRVHVVSDEHGSVAFMDEVKRYVAKRHVPSLFTEQSTFDFVDSKSDALVQVADLFAGTVMRAVRDGGEDDLAMLALLRNRVQTFVTWPTVFLSAEPVIGSGEQYERDRACQAKCVSGRFQR